MRVAAVIRDDRRPLQRVGVRVAHRAGEEIHTVAGADVATEPAAAGVSGSGRTGIGVVAREVPAPDLGLIVVDGDVDAVALRLFLRDRAAEGDVAGERQHQLPQRIGQVKVRHGVGLFTGRGELQSLRAEARPVGLADEGVPVVEADFEPAVDADQVRPKIAVDVRDDVIVVGVRPHPRRIQRGRDAGFGVNADAEIEAPLGGVPQIFRSDLIEMHRAEAAGIGAGRIGGGVISIEIDVAVLVDAVRQSIAVDVEKAHALHGFGVAAADLNAAVRQAIGRAQPGEAVRAAAVARQIGEVLRAAHAAPRLLRREAGVAVAGIGRRHGDVVEGVAIELRRAALARHGDRGQEALVEVAFAVAEDVAPHQVAPGQHVDRGEPMARVGFESLTTRREAIRPAVVEGERDVVERAGALHAGVVDARRIHLGPRFAVAAASSLFGDVGVVDGVAMEVDLLLETPAEDVAAGGRVVQARLRRAAVDRARAVLVRHFPPVIGGTAAVPHDAIEAALGAAHERIGRTGDGGELLAVDEIALRAVVTRNAKQSRDLDARQAEVPTDAEPAVAAAAAAVVMHAEVRLHLLASGRQRQREVQQRVAARTTHGRRDLDDLGGGIGLRQFLQRVRSVIDACRFVRQRQRGVDEIGEVIGRADDEARRLRLRAHARNGHPPSGVLVEEERANVGRRHSPRDERRVIRQAQLDRFLETQAMRTEAEAARLRRDVGHAGVERRKLLAAEPAHGQLDFVRQRAGDHVEARVVEAQRPRRAGIGVESGVVARVAAVGRRFSRQLHGLPQARAVRINHFDVRLPRLSLRNRARHEHGESAIGLVDAVRHVRVVDEQLGRPVGKAPRIDEAAQERPRGVAFSLLRTGEPQVRTRLGRPLFEEQPQVAHRVGDDSVQLRVADRRRRKENLIEAGMKPARVDLFDLQLRA